MLTATVALTGAAGLWRYHAFAMTRAVLVGLSICAVDFASGAALIGGLLMAVMSR